MVRIDLITGFLGAGKTSFIRRYASYLISRGERVGILENDHGAVNVDMMLLGELESDRCGLEMVAGGCDMATHQRRFRTKLIAMAMEGYDRVLVEPSGIYEVDEFFDVLREEPLDAWYEIGSVLTIVDARLEETMSSAAEYLMASQAACAGRIIISKLTEAEPADVNRTVTHIGRLLTKYRCERPLQDILVCKDWDRLTEEDFADLSACGYLAADPVRTEGVSVESFQTLYYMNSQAAPEDLPEAVSRMFLDPECGHILRIKGFYQDRDGGWVQLNATPEKTAVSPIRTGQSVIIVIGEDLVPEICAKYLVAQ